MTSASPPVDDATLRAAGDEVVRLLRARDYASIAQRHGYLLAHGTPPATAIRVDVEAALAQARTTMDALGVASHDLVRYEPNDTGLLAVLEIQWPAPEKTRGLLVALVVLQGEGAPRIQLEDIGAWDEDPSSHDEAS